MSHNDTQAPYQSAQTERRLVELIAAAPHFYNAVSHISAEAFLDAQAREAWQKLSADIRAGRPIDLLDYEAFVNDWQPVAAVREFAENYAADIASRATARNVLALASSLAKSAYKLDVAAIRATLAAVDDLFIASASNAARSVGDIAIELYDELADPAGMYAAIKPTRLRSLDRALGGGVEAGTLCGIAARPSMGKSALAIQIADECSLAGDTVVYFSGEMTERQIVRRMAMRRARVNWQQYMRKETTAAENDRVIREALALQDRANMIIVDKSSFTPGEVYETCQQIGGVDWIVADHLRHFVEAAENANKATGNATRGLKGVAKDLDTRVLLAIQLSRAAVAGSGIPAPPDLPHLRDSGEIEEDLDYMVALHRRRYYNPDIDDLTAELWIRKAREGARNIKAVAAFIEGYSGFEGLA